MGFQGADSIFISNVTLFQSTTRSEAGKAFQAIKDTQKELRSIREKLFDANEAYSKAKAEESEAYSRGDCEKRGSSALRAREIGRAHV